jgi:hypothetical protein
MLKENIYYADKWLLDQLDENFELVDQAPWVKLFRQKENGSLWRLNDWDKYQTRYFVRIQDPSGWGEFDATPLQIELLRMTRGVTDNTCSWVDCSNPALVDLAFCEQHAYREMGVRR